MTEKIVHLNTAHTQAANMATNEIDVICGQLINAVRAMMDPMTPSQVRLNAFKHCEQFKEESPADLGIQCAITLSSSSGNLYNSIHRTFNILKPRKCKN